MLEFILVTLLNGLSYGLLLFMLSSGLTLIYSMMGVINFAHASFYMLGAYVAYTISLYAGFWVALIAAPVIIGILGALVEHYGLRRVHKYGHIPELLFTFGFAYIAVEVVQLLWGRSPVPYTIPAALDGSLFTLYSTTFPLYRGFMLLMSFIMLVCVYGLIRHTRIGLIVQAALTHPAMAEALGHNVPRIFMLVFGGGSALAALAGVIGGAAFVTEPSMAASVGSIIFVVVVVGGLGSLAGAFIASLVIGLMQTFAVALDYSFASVLTQWGFTVSPDTALYPVLRLTIAQVAPILPYVLLVLMLIVRPKGFMGKREG